MAKNNGNGKPMEEVLWDSANKLRGTVESSEYKHVVLGLIFLKFASDKFEERRKELVKVVGQKTEEARIKVRKLREGLRDEIQKDEKDGTISEDDKYRDDDELQKIVDEYNKQIEGIHTKKEEDLMSV